MASMVNRKTPRSLYDPIRHVLEAGGKRIRPVVTLLACEAVGGRAAEALNAAVAVEMLHTFTLVHDDIMDDADTRRGRATIHSKWNNNVAILAGDELIALAYRALLKTTQRYAVRAAEMFTESFVEVCEGQGFDKEFEEKTDVSINEYLMMIKKKTAAMFSYAAGIGGTIGGGSKVEVRTLRLYGNYLGMAFQLQDDLLDITGNRKSTGKPIGGDLKLGKKTYLVLRAMESTRGPERALIGRVVRRQSIGDADVRRIRAIMGTRGIIDDAQAMVRTNTLRAQRTLDSLPSSFATEMLSRLASQLLERAM